MSISIPATSKPGWRSMRSSQPSYCNRDLPATTRTPARWAPAMRRPSPSSAWLALGKVSNNKIEDVRLAIGSMAVTPLRLRRTEEILLGRAWSSRIGSRSAGRRWKPRSLPSMTFVPALHTGCMSPAICCRNFLRSCSLEPSAGALECAATRGGSDRNSFLLRLPRLGSAVGGDAPLRG